jgi:pyruvate dehydrogenase E2 component (dihydrolipoamide acetyltransferase)
MSEFKLPELGENITQGTVTKILVKNGDAVKKGQNVLELETDKAVVEVPCNVEGAVGEVLVKNGAVVKVGQPVFTLTGTPSKAETPSPTRGNTAETPTPTRSAEQKSGGESVPGKSPSAAPVSPAGTFDMTLPVLGENIEKGTVTKIYIKAGDRLEKGKNILEVETDKAVLDVPSATEGVVKEILIETGAVVKVGQPIFKIEGRQSPAPKNIAEAPTPTRGHDFNHVPEPAAERGSAGGVSTPGKQPSAVPVTLNEHIPVRKDVPAAPSVRLLARELGIDIAQVPGSGPGGRISAADVKAYCKMLNTSRPAGGGAAMASQSLPDFSKWGGVRREAMSNVRKKTAEHLSMAWSSIPHVTQFDKVDITELEKLRKTISGSNKKISVTPFIIKVVCEALKKFPQFNTSIDMASREVVYKDYINIGVAVDTDRGLLVPVLKNVDKMSIIEISDELAAMAERARLRKTTIEEMQGGCFTISNLGGIGGTYFTPIINWPETAILGVSRGAMEQVFVDGQFVPKLMLPLSLSYDHRIIDGADGARFIRWVCEAIQQPFLLEFKK